VCLTDVIHRDFTVPKAPSKNMKNQSVKQLQAKIDYLEKVIALMPGHVYWLDKNNVYQGCNDLQAKAAKLSSRYDIVGKTNHDMIWKDYADVLDAMNMQVIETGKPHVSEETAAMANGLAIYLSQKVPLRDDNDEVIGMLGISFDITERKHMEEELKDARDKAEIVNRAKTEFIRNLEHDIRTPISGIIGVANYLKSHQKNPKYQELLEDVELASCELRDYLNGILEFSRSITNGTPVVLKEFNLKSIITSVLIMEMPTIKNKHLKLNLDYSEELPGVFVGDTFRIHRILLNLVSNAVKFTDKGKITVEVKLKSKTKKQCKLQISIADTGIGIAKHQQGTIYDKFTRCMPANQGVYKGTGLGLWIVKQFLEDLSGSIRLKSNVGKGSVFTITLTLQLPD
jgi:two-component system, OmpR family, aerobic respiration control sensor histidine kinase ArcB